MRSLYYVLFSFIILFASCTKTPAPLTREEVISVIRKFDNGWRHKNMKEVDAVLAPAYVYFTQSGGTFSRDSVVATAGSVNYSLVDMSRSAYDVELFENTAVVSTRWQGKGLYHGTAFDEDQRCSITIIKHHDKIEILSEHCTPIKAVSLFH